MAVFSSFILSVRRHLKARTPKVALRDQIGNEELDQKLAFNNLDSAAGNGCDETRHSGYQLFNRWTKMIQ